ncbi:hypothetical protein BV511_22740 [Methylorubrum extorquens]|nr:hypothetical protein BV511_22740 [Methylorubrum extorquens]
MQALLAPMAEVSITNGSFALLEGRAQALKRGSVSTRRARGHIRAYRQISRDLEMFFQDAM